MSDLTAKQEMFVQEYIVDFNGAQAAIRAGYSTASAKEIASENLTKPNIQQAIALAMEQRKERIKVDQEYVIGTIVNTIERCQQAVPVMEKRDGEWFETGEFKFEANAVLKGAELLGKHLAMFTDKVVGAGENGEHLHKEVDKAPKLTKDEWLMHHGIKKV
jgi:phage terminase small subunit